jgi:hypothetical protein
MKEEHSHGGWLLLQYGDASFHGVRKGMRSAVIIIIGIVDPDGPLGDNVIHP